MHQDNFEGNKEFVLHCKKNKLFWQHTFIKTLLLHSYDSIR